MTNRRDFLRGLAAAAAGPLLHASPAARRPPNIVLILADDLGQRRRPQPVGQRARRVVLEPGGGEEVAH